MTKLPSIFAAVSEREKHCFHILRAAHFAAILQQGVYHSVVQTQSGLHRKGTLYQPG